MILLIVLERNLNINQCGKVIVPQKEHLNSQLDVLLDESEKYPVVCGLSLHTFIVGQPFRFKYLKKMLFDKEGLNEDSNLIVDSDDLLEGDDYFSIRGELIFTKPEEKEVVIKIRQKPRNQQKKALPFKLNLKGEVPINYLKHFISLNVRRIDYQLLIEDFQIIGPLSKQQINNKSKKILKSKN